MDKQLGISPAIENAQHSWLDSPSEPRAINAGLLFSVLDGIDYGVIVVRGMGQILFANRTARVELETTTHIRNRGDRLIARSPKTTLAIEHAILDARNGSRRMVEIPEDKSTLMLSFAPLPNTYENVHSTQDLFARPVLVLMGKREAFNTLSLVEFARIHGISTAERRLLPAICTGASIKKMAQQQGISACTVRVHLKNIRRKTGTASLRPLMLQLMALPPVLSISGM